jgi:hypothetical protein
MQQGGFLTNLEIDVDTNNSVLSKKHSVPLLQSRSFS